MPAATWWLAAGSVAVGAILWLSRLTMRQSRAIRELERRLGALEASFVDVKASVTATRTRAENIARWAAMLSAQYDTKLARYTEAIQAEVRDTAATVSPPQMPRIGVDQFGVIAQLADLENRLDVIAQSMIPDESKLRDDDQLVFQALASCDKILEAIDVCLGVVSAEPAAREEL